MSENFGTDQRGFMSLANQSVTGFNLPQMRRYIQHATEEARETEDSLLESYGAPTREATVECLTHVLDGLIDQIVVATGGILSMGIDPYEAWQIVLRANMSKVDGTLGETVLRDDGQIGKPMGWVSPHAELRKLVDKVVPV